MDETTGRVRVERNGADGEPATDAFQRAIDAAADAGGGTVSVPSGEYVIGTIELASDVTIRLEAGATVKPARDRAAYVDAHVGPDGERPFVLADGVENVSIVGDGVFDGRGTEFMEMDAPIRQHSGESEGHPLVSNAPHRARQGEEFLSRERGTDGWPVAKPGFRPGPMFHFVDCDGVRIRDVTLRDMPAWTISLEGCVDADVRGVDIRNHELIPNCDGVAVVNSTNVHVSDCTIESCDDAITICAAAAGRPCESVTVTNCTLSSSACAIKFGSETAGDIRNCTFQNCVVSDTNRGLGIQHRDSGDIENVLFADIVVETGLLPGPWWGKGEPIYVTSVPRDDATELGTLRNVRFSNVVARSENGAFVYGHGDADVSGVRLHGVRLAIEGGEHADAVGGNADLQPTAVTAPIYELDVAAVHCENVADVALRDVSVEWGDDVPEYCTHAIRATDVDGLVVDGFSGRQAHRESAAAAIGLDGATDSAIRASRAAAGTGTFLSVADTEGDRLFANNDLVDAAESIDGDHEFRCTGNVPPVAYAGEKETGRRG
ncbi:glycoside hydrolase family 28 protein [Natrinema salifodinae]|uniref:Polygalacturonase n=1 Tax=Natrinema salifodinae TaxID=1202768 RepID=A0A1I0QVK9_9EURY|nr:glycosyl hydrolase family 28 protein [Natrinema salifodinae]SEW31627.1 Polygalacturonase [Natrinema salifodinae]